MKHHSPINTQQRYKDKQGRKEPAAKTRRRMQMMRKIPRRIL